jgi:hypothetical protein
LYHQWKLTQSHFGGLCVLGAAVVLLFGITVWHYHYSLQA